MMQQIGQKFEDEDAEIKIVPMDGCFIVQVSSGVLRGTLIIDGDLEKEELVEFSEALYDAMQNYDLYVPDDERPQ